MGNNNSSHDGTEGLPPRLADSGHDNESSEDGDHNQPRPPYHFGTGDYLILLANFYGGARALGTNSVNHGGDQVRTYSLPLYLIVEIFAYADLDPLVKHEESTELLRARNCNRVYTMIKLKKPKFFVPHSVHFQVESKDQGWSSYPQHYGTRNGSCTFGEASITPKSSSITTSNATQVVATAGDTGINGRNPRYRVFTNIHAGKQFEVQDVTFQAGGNRNEFIEELAAKLTAVEGASQVNNAASHVELALWARSMYPGWAISIKRARIEIRWKLTSEWEAFIEQRAGVAAAAH